MKRATILATAFSMLGCWGASAQTLRAIDAPPGTLPAYEAVTITRSMGLDPLGGPVWRNGRYVMRATDGNGREMRVVLDAGTGHVIAVRPVLTNYYEPGPGFVDPRGPRYAPVYGGRGPAYSPAYPPGGYVTEDDEVAVTAPRVDPREYQRAPAPRQQLTARTPSDSKPAQAPVAVKKKETATQSAKVSPAAAPVDKPKADDSAVKKHEAAEKTAASSPASTTGSAGGEKKEIRKIEIDRKPEEIKPADAAPKKDDVPVNPLL